MRVPIFTYGQPILRVKCKEVDPTSEETKEIIAQLKAAIAQCPNGIGIAAPQIGIDARIFLGKNNEVFINPVIEKLTGNKWVAEEGCLSIPYLYADVTRESVVMASWINEKGSKVREKLGGIAARIFLHEFDHIDGILFTDKVDEPLSSAHQKHLTRLENGVLKKPAGEADLKNIAYPVKTTKGEIEPNTSF